MANTIKFKRASGSDPIASDLAVGEPGLRTDTAELFFKKDDGTVAKVSGGGGGPDFKYLELRNAANNGAASFPGNDFTLVTAGTTNAITPAAANTLLVSVSGVIQKPNSGTSTSGITGFIVDGSRLKTATNLPAAPDFILYQESGGIGEPSDNTVTSAKIVDGAILNVDINASAAIAGSKVAPDFGSQDITTTGHIDLPDNAKIKLGTGDDLEIYHNGTESWIKNTTGTLNVLNDGTFQFKNLADNETIAQFNANGACSLYYDNSKKFETHSAGVKVSAGNLYLDRDNAKVVLGASDDLQIYHDGSNSYIDSQVGSLILRDTGGLEKFKINGYGATFNDDIILQNDNDKIRLGAGDDLEIYHDGNHSYLHNKVGSFFIRGDTIKIRNAGGNEDFIDAFDNGTVRLYYDNSVKFETTSSGVDVTGNCTITGNFRGNDNVKLNLGNGDDLQIYHNGNHSFLHNSTGDFVFEGNSIDFYNAAGNEVHMKLEDNAGVELYYDNSLRFETNASATTMRGGGDHRCEGNFRPFNHNTFDLGTSGDKWDDIFATNGTIQTSDRNAKKDIAISDLGLTFINAVQPVSYKFKTGTRTHYGVIAQDLETVLDGKDFAGLTKDTETGNYGIRYTELIAPLIKAVQELSAKVAALEAS